MKISTLGGMAAGSVLGLAVGASMMMMPQSRKMRRMMARGSSLIKKQMEQLWKN